MYVRAEMNGYSANICERYTKYTKNKGKLYAAFIDFKKAYDLVNRDILLSNLQNLQLSHSQLCSKTSYTDNYTDPKS